MWKRGNHEKETRITRAGIKVKVSLFRSRERGEMWKIDEREKRGGEVGREREREKKRETKPVGGSQVIYSGYTWFRSGAMNIIRRAAYRRSLRLSEIINAALDKLIFISDILANYEM